MVATPSAPSDTAIEAATAFAVDAGTAQLCIVHKGELVVDEVFAPSLDLVVARTALFPVDGRRPAPMERRFWSLLMDGPA